MLTIVIILIIIAYIFMGNSFPVSIQLFNNIYFKMFIIFMIAVNLNTKPQLGAILAIVFIISLTSREKFASLTIKNITLPENEGVNISNINMTGNMKMVIDNPSTTSGNGFTLSGIKQTN
jgi:hypothetical protein